MPCQQVMDAARLKERLEAIRTSGWTFPDREALETLFAAMLTHIGTTDPQLRDTLIYIGFTKLFAQDHIERGRYPAILAKACSERFLLYRLGEAEGDSVFRRSFSVLLADVILEQHNIAGKTLPLPALQDAYQAVLRYFCTENDLRGYVEGKGWAHACAHGADALCSLVQAGHTTAQEQQAVLEAIYHKVNTNSTTFINEEEERMGNVVVAVLEADVLGEAGVAEWLEGFAAPSPACGYPAREHLRENRKRFLQCLYFRFLNGSWPLCARVVCGLLGLRDPPVGKQP